MVIQLNEIPDCESCKEQTKIIVGRTIDLDGPGICTKVYDCRNTACKARRNIAMSHLIQFIENERSKEQ